MLAGHGKVDGSGGSVYCCHDYAAKDSFTTSIALDAVRSMAKRTLLGVATMAERRDLGHGRRPFGCRHERDPHQEAAPGA